MFSFLFVGGNAVPPPKLETLNSEEQIMKAATYDNYGPADVLNVSDVERPAVGPHDILVEVHASAVTQGDRRIRASDFPGATWLVGRMMYGLLRPKYPVVGSVFAGKVVEAGPEVTKFELGDDVFGIADHGAHAEFISVAEDSSVARMPSNLEYDEAAILPYGASTAVAFLRDMAEVQPGERVLIVGASGGVGRFAVQIAKFLGAHVTGVCRGEDAEMVRELGADQVIDYTTQSVLDGNADFDVVFDTSGSMTYSETRAILSNSGRFLSLEVTPGLLASMMTTSFRKGKRAIFGVAMPTGDDLAELATIAEEGALKTVIDSRFSLDQIRDAHVRLERDRPHGSVVVSIGAPRGV